MTASTAIVQIRADPSMRGRVLALQAMVFLGSTPIGGPIVGSIAETFGARYGVALGAVAALGGRRVRLLHRPAQPQVVVKEVEPLPFRPDAPGDLKGPRSGPRAEGFLILSR